MSPATRVVADVTFEENADPLLLVGRDRTIVAMNRAARAFFGEPGPGTTCRDLLHCRDSLGRARGEGARCFGVACLANRQNLHNVNMMVTDKDEAELPVSASYTYLEDVVPGGGFLISLRDLRPYLRWHDRHLRHAQAAAEREERQRLARDMHDGLGQILVTLRMLIRVLNQGLEDGNLKATKAHLDTLARMIDQAVDEMHRTVENLHRLPDASLGALLEELRQSFAGMPGPRWTVELKAADATLRPDVRHDVQQVVKEAMTNALRHAYARSVNLRLLPAEGGLVIRVEDDGIGMDPSRVSAEGHFGLVSMQERATRLGGRIRFQPRDGGGTVVELFLPESLFVGHALGVEEEVTPSLS